MRHLPEFFSFLAVAVACSVLFWVVIGTPARKDKDTAQPDQLSPPQVECFCACDGDGAHLTIVEKKPEE